MRILAGTSGYAFKEWKGVFYPEDLKDAGFLGYYAGQFPTVEINNTFYQLPKEKTLLEWASRVPEQFSFTIKASQRITHFARLKPESVELVEYLVRTLSALGPRLGPVLFQLPPNMKSDMDRLRAFLDKLPSGPRYAMEFRHESWFGDELSTALRARDVAMVGIEQEDFASPVVPTSTWGYLRLHRFDYTPAMLETWVKRIREQGWTEAYVFFKHDHFPGSEGSGPLAVQAFSRVVEQTA
ncbi:MAG: DUF72 domain-containing protein [Gemmatimonadaceae bacterium]